MLKIKPTIYFVNVEWFRVPAHARIFDLSIPSFILIVSLLTFSVLLSVNYLEAIGNLDAYKEYLEKGTYDGQNWHSYDILPKSRYETFKACFENFEAIQGKVIVELGTSRSYTHGGLEGCNSDDIKYWTPDQPQNWDWGAGFFTRMALES